MRWFIISLVLLNIAIGGWQLLVRMANESDDLPRSRSFARVLQPESITLLKEAEEVLTQGDSVFESALALKNELEKETLALRNAALGVTVQEEPVSARLDGVQSDDVRSGDVRPDAAPVDSDAGGSAPLGVVSVPQLPDGVEGALPSGCSMLGPFVSESMARSVLASADLEGLAPYVHVEQISSKRFYWVYLAPTASRAEAKALLAQVRAKKVDSFVILKGELRNGISLGVYRNPKFAHNRVETTRRLGLAPLLKTVDRNESRYWLVFGQGKKDYAVLANLMKNRSDLKIKEDFCGLDIASDSNFH